MSDMPFAAIILAAGRSSRMGRFKPLLEIDGQTLIQRTIALFRQNRIDDIIVVTGHRAADLEGVLAQEGVCPAHNKFYDQGMFSSVKAGMRHLPYHCEAIFVLPVDVAFVQATTIGRLMEAFRDHPDCICYPCFAGRRGHPPLIPSRLAEAIAAHDGTGGLRQALKRWEDRAFAVDVADRYILLDIDTPGDLTELNQRPYLLGIIPYIPTPSITAFRALKRKDHGGDWWILPSKQDEENLL